MSSQEERLRIIADKHKPLYTKNTSLEGFSLTVYPHVFMPNGMSTKIFKKIILKLNQKYGSVLDMGCGSGILSLIISQKTRKVISADVNMNAVLSTRNNVKDNLIDNVEVRQSNLFENVPERFDLIIFNPPFMNLEPNSQIESALTDFDHQTLCSFFKGARNHLKPGGKIILEFSDMGDETILDNLITKYNFAKKILYQKNVKDFADVPTKVYVLELIPI